MSDLAKLAPLVSKLNWQLSGYKLNRFYPYRWQQKFLWAGLTEPERMLMAANRVGKTADAGFETALHLTGDYDTLPKTARYPDTLPNGEKHPNAGELVWPDGWKGKRFKGPTLVWTGSPTNETSRDIVQTELLGGLGEKLGTGWVPRGRIVGQPQTRQAGVKNVIDTFAVRHASGGLSLCNLKTYEQGWQKWQGTAPHVVWLDEEPDDYKIYSESQTRILTSGGILLVTFTPLLGSTELVEHFQEGGPGIFLMGATWNDAPHLKKEDRDRLAASYRTHERAARTEGIPMMGEGGIFTVLDETISCDPFEIPGHFARIKGCDFGYEHAAAGAEIAIDRDKDIIYVIDCYKKTGQLPPYHAEWFNKSNRDVPVAWPHDGLNTEKSGGNKIKDAYASYGVNMMAKSARYPKSPGEDHDKGGGQPQWPIIDEIRDRMMSGKFKVFSHLREWFEEKRSYHVKDNKIVSRKDDILKATFYAVMMKRYAESLDTLSRPYVSHAPQHPIASTRL